MRTLVEQTIDEAKRIISHIGLEGRLNAQVLMGGVDQSDWHIYPERPAILVGTQDMLLSRSLNRGFACGRARWPVEYGLLNHDALWVMDEVQLMDVGLATSAQLQSFRDDDQTKSIRPCFTWWMSATLQPEWLKSVDTDHRYAEWTSDVCSIGAQNRVGGLFEIQKTVKTEAIDAKKPNEFAKRILAAHEQATSGDHGKITLVICNTVDRAVQTFNALKKDEGNQGIELVHSRFRAADRESWRERFLTRNACRAGIDRIIVATQVVEAGVDISATCLITELAPWPSLVQRFGRCARYGGSGQVIVVNRGHDEKTSPPYSPQELESAWSSIQTLADAGVKSIEEFEQSLSNEARSCLYPYVPAHLLMRDEFDELFDTTPDLTGADLDVSRFIRTGDERDLQVFWRSIPKNASPNDDLQPHRQELCSVPFLKARDWLCGSETSTNRKPKLRAGVRAWIWDWIDGKWREPKRENLLPGRIVLVEASTGGYDPATGFDPESKKVVLPVTANRSLVVEQSTNADLQDGGEDLSHNNWKTIAFHSQEVVVEVSKIASEIALSLDIQKALRLAAIWHDIGKSHPAFQGAMRHKDRPGRDDVAKAPDDAWLNPKGTYRCADDRDSRPGFRHELASALAMFSLLEKYEPSHPALLGNWSEVFAAMGKTLETQTFNGLVPDRVQEVLACSAAEFDLLVFLIASHHGKVRAALHASPKDQNYRDMDNRGLPIRGVREGDKLPSMLINESTIPIPELTLTLEPANLGLSFRTGASWRERCIGLLKQYGPTTLAYLEALFRAADVRASKLKTRDPAIELNVHQVPEASNP